MMVDVTLWRWHHIILGLRVVTRVCRRCQRLTQRGTGHLACAKTATRRSVTKVCIINLANKDKAARRPSPHRPRNERVSSRGLMHDEMYTPRSGLDGSSNFTSARTDSYTSSSYPTHATKAQDSSGQQMYVPKYRKRSRAPAPGVCHSCGNSDTPEWRRGPDGARTLCNACGLHFAKLVRRRTLEYANSAPGVPIPPVTIAELRQSTNVGNNPQVANADSERARVASGGYAEQRDTSTMARSRVDNAFSELKRTPEEEGSTALKHQRT